MTQSRGEQRGAQKDQENGRNKRGGGGGDNKNINKERKEKETKGNNRKRKHDMTVCTYVLNLFPFPVQRQPTQLAMIEAVRVFSDEIIAVFGSFIGFARMPEFQALKTRANGHQPYVADRW